MGRAVYDALLERIVEADDKRETSTRHRDHLAAVVEEHGPVAAKLDVDALEADIGALPPKLRIVLTATKTGSRPNREIPPRSSTSMPRPKLAKGRAPGLRRRPTAAHGASNGRATSTVSRDHSTIDGSRSARSSMIWRKPNERNGR